MTGKNRGRRHDRPAPEPTPGRLVRRVPDPLTPAEASRWLLDAVRAWRRDGDRGAALVLRACPRPGDVLLIAVQALARQLCDAPDQVVDAALDDADAALALLDLNLDHDDEGEPS